MFYLLSLIIFSLKIRIEIIKASIVYILKTIIFLIVILSKLAFITPLIIVTQDSKGKYSHILEIFQVSVLNADTCFLYVQFIWKGIAG